MVVKWAQSGWIPPMNLKKVIILDKIKEKIQTNNSQKDVKKRTELELDGISKWPIWSVKLVETVTF